jgi:hypothetical protein
MSEATLFGESLTRVQEEFVAALPAMENVIRFQLRWLPRRHRAEAQADAVAASWHAWHGLVKRGKDPLSVGPAGIALNATRYTRAGRRLGTGTSTRGAMDVYNRKAQKACGLKLISLHGDVETDGGARSDLWREWLAEDNTTTPGDEAAFRIDLAAWLSTLPERKRQMAELLAQGFGTGEVATLLSVTPAAVSIARTWLEASWRAFQGESVREDVTSVRRPVGRPRREDRDARGRKRGQTVTREMVRVS